MAEAQIRLVQDDDVGTLHLVDEELRNGAPCPRRGYGKSPQKDKHGLTDVLSLFGFCRVDASPRYVDLGLL